MTTPRLIGIDLGGTKCAVGVAEADGAVREIARFPSGSPDVTLDRVAAALAPLGELRDPVFGIACGGPLDAARGLILSPPNLPGWDEVAITDECRRRFGGEARLMNDANACALAEWHWGAGRGCRHLVFLTMGTGMGAGLILNGQLYEGASGQAGEFGHARLAPTGPVGFGKAGSFEGFCSGGGIAQLVRSRVAQHRGESRLQHIELGRLTARDLAVAAEAGDTLARTLWMEIGTRLGEALAWIIDGLNPERIILGSIYARCEAFIAPALHAVLQREALPANLAVCRILPAALGETLGCYAAIAVARHHLASSN
jgi:glucokinase